MNRRHTRRRGKAQTTAASIFSTLLHECCHAYFEIVCCKGIYGHTGCWRGCGMEFERVLSREGHGEAFQYLAADVERVGSIVLGMQLDLGREDALTVHFVKPGRTIDANMMAACFPGQNAVRRCVDGKEVIELVQQSDDEARGAEFRRRMKRLGVSARDQ